MSTNRGQQNVHHASAFPSKTSIVITIALGALVDRVAIAVLSSVGAVSRNLSERYGARGTARITAEKVMVVVR